MFLPINDDTPLRVIRFQFVTVAIIVLNIAIFLVTGPLAGAEAAFVWATGFGVVPSELLAVAPNVASGFDPIAEPLTLITYMFLHGGWLHLISNMAFIWVFADNIEDAFGSFGFALFYVVCGAAGALAHVMMSPSSTVPLIGASGAASGVIASYLLLYPHARVWVLLFMRIPVRFQAFWVLGGWALLQVVSVFMEQSEDQAVAWWAHIGGFIAGFTLTLLLRKRLFQSQS